MTVTSLALPFKAKHNNAPAKGISMSVNIVSMTVNFSNALFMNQVIEFIFGERKKKGKVRTRFLCFNSHVLQIH